MNLLSKLTDIVGGSLFKEVKEIINDRWPPEISPEKRAEIELALGELQAKSQQAAGQLALEQLRHLKLIASQCQLGHKNPTLGARAVFRLSFCAPCRTYCEPSDHVLR